MVYASYTRATPEPLKGWVHRRRYTQVVRHVAKPISSDRVLDYGCGDAHLFSHFKEHLGTGRLVGYDPDKRMLSEASVEVAQGATLTSNLDEISGRFSLIYCVEVCEHLPDGALRTALRNLKAYAAPHARIVIGVPVEIGLSGAVKEAYRSLRGSHQGAFLRSLVGRPGPRRMTDMEWYGYHTGFDHRRLKKFLDQEGFAVRRQVCLPFPGIGAFLNNEIFFICSVAPST